jgi:hypothetical protein
MGQPSIRHPPSPIRVCIHLLALVAACVFLFGCGTEKKRLAEAIPSPTAPPNDQTQQMAKLPPPELTAVQVAVKRVFKESALVDTSRKPVFIAGDFNGDLSQDIAVVLKPAPERLSDMNDELPTWILRDPSAGNESQMPRLRVAASDVLLAVIHGYGPSGWRDEQATQTFLLKNAVGSGMEARQAKDVASASQGKKHPQLNGDVIGEVLRGTSGYLYYSNASYSWYDPKTFNGDPEPGMFHMRPKKGTKK